jgi:hypothetical protein
VSNETLTDLRASAQEHGVNLPRVPEGVESLKSQSIKNEIQPITPERKNTAFENHKNRINRKLDSLELERIKLTTEITIFPNHSVKEIYRIVEIGIEIELYLSCYDSVKYRQSVIWKNRLNKFRALSKWKTSQL